MKYAVFCDLNSINISYKSFKKAIDSIDGKLVYSKFYGFSSKKNNDFSLFIKTNNSDIALPVQNRKKVRIDIRQVIDVSICSVKQNIDCICIVCSELDAKYLLQAVKSQNKRIVLIGENSSLKEYVDEYIEIDRMATFDNSTKLLPYVDIEDENDSLKQVKNEIMRLIEKKSKEIDCSIIQKTDIDVETLLKKYF